MPRSCLVTGATGFVGINLCRRLLAEGWEVHALTRNPEGRGARLLVAAAAGVALVRGELGVGADLPVPPGCDVIFHLALAKEDLSAARARRGGLAQAGWCPETRERHLEMAENSSEEVAAAAVMARVRRVVFCSSWSAYGFQAAGAVVDERAPRLASEAVGGWGAVPYMEGKAAAERLLRRRCADGGVQLVIIQPASIFGPYGEAGWCALFARMERERGGMVGLPGACSAVDARDLAAAFVAAADVGVGAGEAYVAAQASASNLELQGAVARVVGVPAPQRAAPAWLLMLLARFNEWALGWLPALRVRPATIGHPWLMAKLTQDQTADASLARRVLGLEPRPLEEMLRANYAYLLEAGVCRGAG